MCLKKLFEGFVFGAGFSLAFILVVVFATPLLTPISYGPFPPDERSSSVEKEGISSGRILKEEPRFYELPLEEKIKQASVIALARYEAAPDGRMKAVIQEFLKKEPNTVIHYKIGDEYASGSYYPSEERNHGDGVIIFFTGSPADMRSSMNYSGDRIRGLADIPIELFREKCEASNASASG